MRRHTLPRRKVAAQETERRDSWRDGVPGVVSELTTPRHKHDAVRLADGRVIVVGGADRTDRNHFRTTEIFDPATGTFAPGPSMRKARYKIAGTSVLLPSGDILVGSGRGLPNYWIDGTELFARFGVNYRTPIGLLRPLRCRAPTS